MASNTREDSIEGDENISTVKCMLCFEERGEINLAEFACFDCVRNLCASCSVHHINRNHICKKMNTEEYRTELRKMLNELSNESNRREKFMKETAEVCERINVKSDLDRWHCSISGMCIAENSYSVMCDSENRCLKLFDLRTSCMVRRIRLNSEAHDVTEVNITMDDRVLRSSTSDFSDVNKAEQSKPKLQSYIVATCPKECEILYLNITPTPAKIARAIQTRLPCFSIECSNNVIYTVCRDRHKQNYRWTVDILSSEGDFIGSVDAGIFHPGVSVEGSSNIYLAVFSGNIYLTDLVNKKVKSVNHEGTVISQVTENLIPIGICAAKDNGNIYVCTRFTDQEGAQPNSLYKMNHLLQFKKSLINLHSDSWYGTRPLCHYKDKIFTCFSKTPHAKRNYVTVIQLI